MNNYQKNVLKIVGQIFLIFVIGSLAIFFLLRSINTLTDEIRTKKVFFWANENRPDLVVKLKNDYLSISPYSDKIKSIIPPKKESNNLILKLEELAKNNQSVQKFQYLDQSTMITDDIKNSSFKMTADGNIKNLINYLKEFESLPFLFDIKSVNILDKGDKSNLSLFGSIYIREE